MGKTVFTKNFAPEFQGGEDAALKMRLYTAGPMTWEPQFNYPAFEDLAEALREEGFAVLSPAELDSPEIREKALASETGDPADLGNEETWGDMLARDVKIISDEADGVVLMPGWTGSKGARLEAFVARHVGKPVFYATPRTWLGPTGHARHDKVCFCKRLYPTVETNLIELDDEELDFVLMASDTLTLMKMEQDAVKMELWGMPVEIDEGLKDDEIIIKTDSGATRIMNVGKHAGKMEVARQFSGEVRVTDPDTGGQKGAKLARYDLIPPLPLEALAEHYGKGAEKYDARNWERGYDWSLCFAAMQRHLWAWWNGETDDPETGSNHLTAAAWHCFALLEFDHTHPEKDDRP